MSRPPVLVVGCGYLGSRVVRRLVQEGFPVTATTRSRERLGEIERLGARALMLDLAEIEASRIAAVPCRIVVYAVAPGRGGDGRLAYLEGPLRLLEAIDRSALRRFVYISSTGVHAQRQGEEVDEESPALSDDGHHRWIRAGEGALLEKGRGGLPEVVVLRLAGIYGPGRSPAVWLGREDFRRRLGGSGDAFSNWIHVEDAAQSAANAAAGKGRGGEVYVIADGHPVRRRDLYAHAARLAGVEPPSLERGGDLGKRLENEKMLAELGVKLRYRDVLSGMSALEGAEP